MSQIDKFIEALHKYKSENLEVMAGAQVTLGMKGSQRAVTAQPVTAEQVERLVNEIMPQAGEGVTNGPQGERFTYKAPSGVVTVNVTRPNGSLRLLIKPLDEAAAALAMNGNSEMAAVQSRGGNGGALVSVGDDSAALVRIEGLFRMMVEEGCSDLHLSTGSPPLFRKDGDIVSLTDEAALTSDETRSLLSSITPLHKRAEFDERNDTDFAYEIPDLARFRCNLFMDHKGMGGVFRVIPAEIITVEDLGLSPQIIDLCFLSKGLVLVTGPTGSGKSTTLAALIDHINCNRTDHILTIEDPIEFVHHNKKCLINQREVGVHTNGFKVALRAALREDPDVVLVGELRDLETMAIAIETAETGHLVFGTLHTNTAASTVDRIIDQFPADRQAQIRAMLSESLKGVISQTLLKKKGGGRVAALEFLYVNTAVSNLIREGKTFQIPSIMQSNKAAGMKMLNVALVELVQAGQVEVKEALLKSVDRADLETQLSRAGVR